MAILNPNHPHLEDSRLQRKGQMNQAITENRRVSHPETPPLPQDLYPLLLVLVQHWMYWVSRRKNLLSNVKWKDAQDDSSIKAREVGIKRSATLPREPHLTLKLVLHLCASPEKVLYRTQAFLTHLCRLDVT